MRLVDSCNMSSKLRFEVFELGKKIFDRPILVITAFIVILLSFIAFQRKCRVQSGFAMSSLIPVN